MLRRVLLIVLFLIVALLVTPIPAAAHANLSQSDPIANTSLPQAPEEIRLWFTEPLETEYSRFYLQDVSGNRVDTPPSMVDPANPMQMYMQPGDLPLGLYTVVWRVVSSADGHPTQGNFAFGIGVTVSGTSAASVINENVTTEGVIVRWFNLISLSLAIGSIGFWLFVWQPTSDQTHTQLNKLVWIGWFSLGIASIFTLLLQTAIANDTSLFGALPYALTFVSSSAFGNLWLMRIALWLAFGIPFFRQHTRYLWVILGLGAGILLTQSLFSHASGAQDSASSIAADWLHLLATTFWIGGLIAFVVMLWFTKPPVEQTAQLVAYFSNYARTAVGALIITGTYAAWLQIGSFEALLTTVYGRALVVKLALFLPLLGIAGINLLVTSRRLQSGETIWVGRLRQLVSAEITLTIGILIAVGVMTSGVPARGIEAIRNAEAPAAVDAAYFGMEVVNDQMMHLEIDPGYVGENTFTITPFDETGAAIEDASLIRLRFTNLDQDIGQSELRPEALGSGLYRATGANLSTPGHWRIRMTVQRPGEFDTVVDFETEIGLPSAPHAPTIDTSIPYQARFLAALWTGIALFGLGGFLLPNRLRSGEGVLCVAMIGVGLIFSVTAAANFTAGTGTSGELTVEGVYARSGLHQFNSSVYLTINNDTASDERLIGATTDVADVELHLTNVEDDIARMRQQTEFDIPAGENLQTEVGSYHIMLVNLRRDLVVGDIFQLTLLFASGKEISVDVLVRDG